MLILALGGLEPQEKYEEIRELNGFVLVYTNRHVVRGEFSLYSILLYTSSNCLFSS